MRLITCEQGSDAWKAARCGKITASRIVDVINYLKKGGEGADRRNYRIELVAERLTEIVDDSTFQTKWLRDGRTNEPFARAAYEVETGNFIDQHGFALHPFWDFSGASPDGLFGKHGGVEIKCPKSTTHVEWMEAGVVPEEHIPQMQWTMLCCQREWLDFVSFDPRMPDDLQMFIARLNRDDEMIYRLEGEVRKFHDETDAQIARLYGTRCGNLSGDHAGMPESPLVQSLHRSLDEGFTEGDAESGRGGSEAPKLQAEQVRGLL